MDVLDPPPAAAVPRSRRSQRWRERRALFVPDDSVIDPSAFAVDVIAPALVRDFVVRHRYAGSFPAARLSLGLFGPGPAGPSQLVGVATFSTPINERCVARHTGLAEPRAGADLGRFVLLDAVPGNGETWFLAGAFRLLRREKPQIEAVIAYSDPVARVGPDGRLASPGHVGAIYRDFGRGLACAGSQMLRAPGAAGSRLSAWRTSNLASASQPRRRRARPDRPWHGHTPPKLAAPGRAPVQG